MVYVKGKKPKAFSTQSTCLECGLVFPPLDPRMFSFNSRLGSCQSCDGRGTKATLDPTLIFPDLTTSLDSITTHFGASRLEAIHIERSTQESCKANW